MLSFSPKSAWRIDSIDSSEEIEKEYPQYSDQLKWQLVENKIIQENELKVEIEEVKDYVKGMLVQQYVQYNMPTPDDAALEENALGVLKNQDETKKIFDYLSEQDQCHLFLVLEIHVLLS